MAAAVVLAGFSIYALWALPGGSLSAFNLGNQPSGSIIICAQDGLSREPMAGVEVVIPETGERYTTDETGKTPPIAVPVIPDENAGKLMPQTWGEITVLGYKPGYADYAIFGVHVWENQTRYGPTLYMFETDPNAAGQPYTLCEGPHRLWVQQLLDKYR